MSQVEKHPTDDGKYQSTISDYGHGKGNGKSRAAVYKHNKKYTKSTKNRDTRAGDNAGAKSREKVKSKKEDFVESDDRPAQNEDFGDIDWLEEEEDEYPSTIPRAIRGVATGAEMSQVARATQGQLVRWGYMGVDRGITHWGRGVTQNPEYEIKRSTMDYDAMEGATMVWLESKGISINLTPGLVLTATLGAAYGPPIYEIAQEAETTVTGRLMRIITWPVRRFRKRRNQASPPVRPLHATVNRETVPPESEESGNTVGGN